MYFIHSWDISEVRPLDGPYNTAAAAWSKIDDCRDDYLEQVTVVGPLPEVARTDINNGSRFDVSPDSMTADQFMIATFAAQDAAQGLGMYLASLPDDSGWNSASFFDHDSADHIMSFALDNAKSHAKANNLFYNTVKLEDACTQALVVAYGRGWDYMKSLVNNTNEGA